MKKQTLIKIGVLCAIIVVILVIDLVSKYVIDAKLDPSDNITIIPYLINFQIVYNRGAAWGILYGKQVFLIAVTILFLAIFIYYYTKEKKKTWLLTVTFGFLIGGCIGNLYDRIVLRYVRDFIQFDFWQSFPTFNFADVFLTIGVVLFIIYIILYFVKEKKEEKCAEIIIERNEIDVENDKNNNIEEIEIEGAKNKKYTQNKEIKNVEKSTKNEEKTIKNEEKSQKNTKNTQKNIKKDKKTENVEKNLTENKTDKSNGEGDDD